MVDERNVPKGYKVTEVGIIPEEWKIKKLGEVLNNPKLGGNYSNSMSMTQYPLIKMGNISRGSISIDKIEFIEEGIKPLNLHRLKYGDVLFNTRNTLDLVGKVAIWKDELPEAYYNSNLLLLDFHKTFVASTFYMNYILNLKSSIVQLRNIATGTTSVAAIYSRDLYKILVPLPPLQEQKAIAEALCDTDNLISSLEKLIDKKKKIKQGAMQQLLTGKKRLPGFNSEWEVRELGEVADIRTGKRNNQDKVSDGLYPFFVRSQDVERINTYSYDGEAVLVPGEGGIGNIFHYINGKFEVHQRVYKISDFLNVSGKYVYYYMKQNFGAHAMKNTVKATVDSLRLPTFQEFELKIPNNLEEQKAIAQVLSDMDAEIEALEEKLEKVKTIKQGMMQELLTGRIRLI